MTADNTILDAGGCAELAYLACLVLADGSPRLWSAARRHLDAGDWADPRAETLWRAMRELDARGAAVDAVTLREELARTGELQRLGGARFLGDWLAGCPSAYHAPSYLARVLDERVRRRAARWAADFAGRLASARVAAEVVAEACGELAELRDAAAAAIAMQEHQLRRSYDSE